MSNDDAMRGIAMRRIAASGEALARRRAAGLSLRDMASLISGGVAPSTLHRWEQGEVVPRLGLAVAWARALERVGQDHGDALATEPAAPAGAAYEVRVTADELYLLTQYRAMSEAQRHDLLGASRTG